MPVYQQWQYNEMNGLKLRDVLLPLLFYFGSECAIRRV
jgi:hypothetical protein